MNQNLKKIMDELAEDFDDSYWIFQAGFKAAIPHVREEILDLIDNVCYAQYNPRLLIEKELERMDEE